MKKVIIILVVAVVSYVCVSDNMLDNAVSSMKAHNTQLEEALEW